MYDYTRALPPESDLHLIPWRRLELSPFRAATVSDTKWSGRDRDVAVTQLVERIDTQKSWTGRATPEPALRGRKPCARKTGARE